MGSEMFGWLCCLNHFGEFWLASAIISTFTWHGPGDWSLILNLLVHVASSPRASTKTNDDLLFIHILRPQPALPHCERAERSCFLKTIRTFPWDVRLPSLYPSRAVSFLTWPDDTLIYGVEHWEPTQSHCLQSCNHRL